MKCVDEIPRIWTEPFRIRSFDVGLNTYISPQALCRLIQEAAGNHAYQLRVATDLLADQKLMWVLSQIRIVMADLPLWREDISIQTWPTNRSSGVRAFRDFRILNARQDQIGLGSSRWLLLSINNRRPTKLPESLKQFQTDGLEEELLAEITFEPPQTVSLQKVFDVRPSEIDLNRHVNNVCYVQWAIDTLPIELLKKSNLHELCVSYTGEAKYGDTVVASAEQLTASPYSFRHEIANKSTGQTFALLKTIWHS
jgi:acyl-ACP thioesterase